MTNVVDGMKVSISLATDDVAFLDEFARQHDVGSRSAVVQRAIAVLRAVELESAYSEAWREWAESGEADAWEPVAGDGLNG